MEKTQGRGRPRAPSFKVEIPGDTQYKQQFLEKMQKVREILMRKMQTLATNGNVLETVLDFWLQNHTQGVGQVNPNVIMEKTDTKQDLYIVANSSLKKFLEIADDHARYCAKTLRITKTHYRGHVALCKLSCAGRGPHKYTWSSSPKLPDNKTYLANVRVQHGLIFSGMLPVHYMRFVTSAGIGLIGPKTRRQFLNNYQDFIHAEYKSSIEEALRQEIDTYDSIQEQSESPSSIDIMTDARHGWRKNAKDTSVVAIGDHCHKVLQCVHVTKAEDHVTQRHEKLGTQQIYEYIESKGVNIRVHAHDRNMAINKMVREHSPTVINQNDTWHGVKSVKKALSAIASGPKYKQGKSWHQQLEDKVEPVATHVHWSIRNCDRDADKLREYLANTVDHYKDIHDKCHESSRCRKDEKYEPGRITITASTAEMLLRNAISASTVYKHAKDFIYGKDTYYVESFNNTMNMFQDKRISFGDIQYNVRSELAVCHWNENVDRAYTSTWNPKQPKAPRRRKGKKIYTACTFGYRDNVWERFVSSEFEM